MDSHHEETPSLDSVDGAWPKTPAARACPACGAEARRGNARFCATCGKNLDDDGYLPADAIRASYHFQRREPTPVITTSHLLKTNNRPLSRRHVAATNRRRVSSMPFHKNQNGASTTALAFVTYSLVPYLGILFCPGALVMGGLGLVRASRAPHAGGRRASILSIALGLIIFGAQLFLWWILYQIPDWARQRGV